MISAVRSVSASPLQRSLGNDSKSVTLSVVLDAKTMPWCLFREHPVCAAKTNLACPRLEMGTVQSNQDKMSQFWTLANQEVVALHRDHKNGTKTVLMPPKETQHRGVPKAPTGGGPTRAAVAPGNSCCPGLAKPWCATPNGPFGSSIL